MSVISECHQCIDRCIHSVVMVIYLYLYISLSFSLFSLPPCLSCNNRVVHHEAPAPPADEQPQEGVEGEQHNAEDQQQQQQEAVPQFEDFTETYKTHSDHRPKGKPLRHLRNSLVGVLHVDDPAGAGDILCF